MSQAEEWFDIYDEQLQPAGTATRKEVHTHGYWHHSFQCWIVNEQDGQRTLLFQMRHADKDTYPGLLDISCAGHLLAGEKIEDGNRELEEELGIFVPFGQLEPCGEYKSEKRLDNGVIDREVCHVFVYRSDRPLAEYKLQADEVTGLYRIRLADVRRLAAATAAAAAAESGAASFRAEGVEPDSEGRLQRVERTFAVGDFVPRLQDYYELVLQIADRG